MQPEEIDRVRRALAGIAVEVPSTASCLDDDMVAALAEGRLDAELRATLLPHLADCARCRSAVASVARALADPDVAREIHAAVRDRRPLQRIGRTAIGIAAAAVLLLIARPSGIEQSLPHRAPSITASPAPEAVWPVGTVADVDSLRWTAVAGADRYRVSVFDATGTVLFERELAATEVALPDSVRPPPGKTYWWKVEARVGFDRWADSDLVQFSIPRGPRR